jgi:hypothetical protein
MKKLFTFLMVCFAMLSYNANAQSPNLTVKNNSGCDICFILYGSKAPRCTPIVSTSKVYCIPAGASITFPSPVAVSFTPPLSAIDYIVGACIYNHDPSKCADIPLTCTRVLDRCVGAPQTVKVDVYNSDCKFCASVTATWTPGTLTFN